MDSSGVWRWLDPEESASRWGLRETIALVLWFGIAGFAVRQHVPWADESQAWLLAAGQDWKTLFLSGLHYEGTGGLWHAFLKVLQLCGIRFTAMRWIVLIIEGAGMAILLRCAPLPRLVRLLLPFTFFLLYQDAVVARSYCLFAVLAFAAAALLRSHTVRPFRLAVLLGIMANLSVHAAIASGGLALVAALAWKKRFLKNGPAMAVLLLLWAFNTLTVVPALDIDFAAGNNLRRSVAKAEMQLGMHPQVPAPLAGLPMAGLAQVPTVVHVRHGFARTWNKVSRILSVVTYPLASSRLLAFALVSLVVAQAVRKEKYATAEESAGMFRAKDSLRRAGLAPYGAMALVFAFLYLAPRHAGMVFTGFVVTAWLTWPRREAMDARELAWSRATAAVFALVCVLQIGWSAHAIAAEHAMPYGPGQMTARYLQSRGIPASEAGHERQADAPRIAGFYYFSIDPLQYFNRNVYFNQAPHRYWLWSLGARNYMSVEAVLAQHPAFIVIGGFDSGPEAEITRDWEPVTPARAGVVLNDEYRVADYFEQHGYAPTRVFCGHSWMRMSYAERLCDTVLEPRASR